jgi:hypothetical protein
MAGSIAGAVARLKDDVAQFLSVEFIARLAGELGLCWRRTPLALPQVVAWFARQILGGNLSMPELARRAGSVFTPEAYCTARGRLPVALLQVMLRRLCALGTQQVVGTAQRLWKGHRLWLMDGSSFSMPDTPALQTHFGQPGAQKKGCGFPVAHLLCLFDAASGLIQECILSPLRTGEMTHVGQIHPQLRPGDILIADRAYESFVHLALLLGRGMHLLVPVHQRRKVDFVRKDRRRGKRLQRIERQRVRRCGRCDQIVQWLKPPRPPVWLSQAQYDALPETIEVRELKRTVRLATGRMQTIVLITTLLDPAVYPAEELVTLLQDRWAVEVNLRHLKTTMGMDVLRSQSVAGIEKELWMFLIVYNLVRLILLEASERQGVSVRRISFADGLYWVRHGDLAQELPVLQVLPERPGRIEPRALKRRPKPYDHLNRPRDVMRKALRNKGK